MKVLVINASANKERSTTLKLTKTFLEGFGIETSEVEFVITIDMNINPCRACYACFKTGKCILNDDMADILDKVQEAEVLVIATPTYFLTMNGMLKATIDRFLPKWQELGGHDVYLIITGHDSKAGLKLVGDELTDIFQNLGNEIKGIIWGENVWQKGEVKTTKAMEEAYHAGLNI